MLNQFLIHKSHWILEAAPFWIEIMFKMFKKCKIKKVGFQKVKNLV